MQTHKRAESQHHGLGRIDASARKFTGDPVARSYASSPPRVLSVASLPLALSSAGRGYAAGDGSRGALGLHVSHARPEDARVHSRVRWPADAGSQTRHVPQQELERVHSGTGNTRTRADTDQPQEQYTGISRPLTGRGAEHAPLSIEPSRFRTVILHHADSHSSSFYILPQSMRSAAGAHARADTRLNLAGAAV
jgi:hypothetical protein